MVLDAQLCYVERFNESPLMHTVTSAFFTTQDIKEQWGDDWNDVPFEHNADRPYEWRNHDGIGCRCISAGGFMTYGRTGCGQEGHKPVRPKHHWEVIMVRFDDDVFRMPNFGTNNSPYSVQDINNGKVPWLTSDSEVPWHALIDDGLEIMAGTTLVDFLDILESLELTHFPNRAAFETYRYVQEILSKDGFKSSINGYALAVFDGDNMEVTPNTAAMIIDSNFKHIVNSIYGCADYDGSYAAHPEFTETVPLADPEAVHKSVEILKKLSKLKPKG